MEATTFPTTHIVDSVKETWGIDRAAAGCLKCGYAFLVPPGWIGRTCPNCFKGVIEEQPAVLRQEPPELYLPFQIDPSKLKDIYTRFTQGAWLAPDDFKPDLLFKRAIRIYWPLWLVDCDVRGAWQAEIGFDYQVKSTVEAYQTGQWNTQQKIENRTRWEIRKGTLDRHYDNISSPAVEDHVRITSRIGNYSLGQAKAYAAGDGEGALIRIPDLAPESTWPAAVDGLKHAASKDCQEACGGQHSRNLSIEADYANQNWSQMLLPLIVTCYRGDDGRVYPVLVNGQTGQISGVRAASQQKGWMWAGVSGGIALFLLLAGVLLAAIPPVSILGVLLILMAFGGGVLAFVAAIWPWQWNRKHQNPDE